MKVLILAAVLAVVTATSPPAFYPTYDAPAPVYAAPSYQPEPAQPYSFEWEVKDAASYNDYSHSESSDGKVVSGSYRVVLPDGRIQVVTYKADAYGYTADVEYTGDAKYFEPATYSVPAYKAPAPAPTPAPAPAYKVVPAIYRAVSPPFKVPVY